MYSLLILTKFYPYGMGEAFIENEIKVLAKYFKKIVIIACEVPNNETHVRTMPSNVTAYKVTSKKKNLQRVFDCISGVGKLISPNEAIKSESYFCKNTLQRLFLGYFEGKSNRVFKAIQNARYLDYLKNEKFVIYSYWFFITARVGIEIKRLFSNNVLYSFSRAHGYDLYAYRNSLSYLPCRELFLKNYDNVFSCSINGRNYLQNLYPNFTEKVDTAFLGTLDNGITSSSTDGIFRIVSCSRLEDVKRVDRIVESLSLLDSSYLNIEWTHIGGGKNFDKIKKLSVKRLNNIKIKLLGNISNQQVMGFYKKHPVDLFVNVSSSEGLPVSIMEAISFGIPIIATDVGGTSEIVINGKTGQLIPCEFENEKLASLIRKMIELKKTDKYMHLRITTRKVWEERFQATTNYEKFCKMIYTHIYY